MEELLKYLLNRYFADFKRSTEAVITKDVDATLRVFAASDPKLKVIIHDCRKVSNVLKKQRSRRSESFNFGKARMVKGSLVMPKAPDIKGLEYVPCRKAREYVPQQSGKTEVK
ncbi:MAG: hypothetical protein KAJ19_27895 [Gammaproteobacteria bacterium]|nr:hypothetical protein [Gammaproteobacteria bacterium]